MYRNYIYIILLFTLLNSCTKSESDKAINYGYKFYVGNTEFSYPYSNKISLTDYGESAHKIILGDFNGNHRLILETYNSINLKPGNNDSINSRFIEECYIDNNLVYINGDEYKNFQVEISEIYIDPNPSQYNLVKGHLKGTFKGNMNLHYSSGFSNLNGTKNVYGEFTVPLWKI